MKININNLDFDEFDDEFVPIEKFRKKPKDRKVKAGGQSKSALPDNNDELDNYKERKG